MDAEQNTGREQRSWDLYFREGADGQCCVAGCSQRCWRSEFCLGHARLGTWWDEVEAQADSDSWWAEQLADYETQARQCLKATLAADWYSSRAATHRLALLAIKALRQLPLDADNGNGGTWRDSLQTVVDIAFKTGD